jgi:hypothetical protein
MSEQPEDAPASRLSLLGIVALILWALYVLVLALAGWVQAGFLGLLAGAVLGAVMGAVVIPLVAVSAYVFVIIIIIIFMFILCGTAPLPPWPRRLRAALRGAIIVGSVACVVLAVPRVLAAPTLKEAREAALMGILLPLGVIFSLYWDRMEEFGKPEIKTGDPS